MESIIFYCQSHLWMQVLLVLITLVIMNGLVLMAMKTPTIVKGARWSLFIFIAGALFGTVLFMVNVWLVLVAVLISELMIKEMEDELDVEYLYISSTVSFMLMFAIIAILHWIGWYAVPFKEILSNLGILAAFAMLRLLYCGFLAIKADRENSADCEENDNYF